MSDEQCLFDRTNKCKSRSEKLIESGHARIESIIRCSKIYDDGLHTLLQEKLDSDPTLTIKCHKSCVSTYTSKTLTQRHKRKHDEPFSSNIPAKITRRSTDISIFSFQHQCLFCGDRCDVEKNIKNPSRWRPAYVCREIGTEAGKASLKESIINACNTRNDAWGEKVRRRVEGALSDLHAADARYHVDCRLHFLSQKYVTLAASNVSGTEDVDEAFEQLVSQMNGNKSKIWNSVELFNAYTDYKGNICARKTLLKKLCEHFGNDLIVLHSSGLADIVVFRGSAAASLRLVEDKEDDIDFVLNKLSKHISLDVKSLSLSKSCYETEIDRESVLESVSSTLIELLAKLSPKLDKTLPVILIGSVITSTLKSSPTGLQVALGVKMGRSKQCINLLHEFGITCTYDEVLRFKRSAAIAATKDLSLTGLSESSSGLVQVVADNFDADIASQNGKLSTHSLAVIITQPDTQTTTPQKPTLKRILKEQMADPLEYDVEVQGFNGPKKPAVPAQSVVNSVLPLKVLCQQIISVKSATQLDFVFFRDILSKEQVPEFHGYNTAVSREQGKPVQLKTKTAYLPLIDMPPSHPDTIMTGIIKAQEVTKSLGQDFVVFTCDLQLYKVAQEVKWAYPKRFENIILRLGGMHSLMSFVGAIGTLMADSGLADIMLDVFGGVSKMLTGKKFPQNVRAMRLVAEAVLQSTLQDQVPETAEGMVKILDKLASQSKTTQLWVDVFLKPVFIMMIYVRAEREGDWPLHLIAYRQMLPYFFASGHVHYARYGTVYLKEMEALPTEVLRRFLRGEHVMRHERGIWNGIWSDMFIESTFMRYGHAPGGIIGITLKPETLKVWALSLHMCSQLEANLDSMVTHKDETKTDIVKHKEEQKSRIECDAKDRKGIMDKLKTCIDPLDPSKHQGNIVNIVTGEVASDDVNVHDTLRVGNEQLKEFNKQLPDGFNGTIHKKITTMSVTKKHVKVGQVKVFDTNVIYSRVLGLQASGREIDIRDVLSHELAPIPTALFDDHGEMRIAKAKASLKKQLQVEVSDRTTGPVDTVIIDGSALLWVIPFPAEGVVKDYLTNFKLHIGKLLEKSNVYLVFDRYYDYSTKGSTRCARATGASRVYQLHANSRLPAQKVLLTVTENKVQLMQLIISDFLDDDTFQAEHTQTHKLVLTGENETPAEISQGSVSERKDLETTHEEADNVIVQQVLSCTKNERTAKLSVICDDTDVFVLLLYYYNKTGMTNRVFMESPIKGRSIIDVEKTVDKHRDIVDEILPVHALSGCDTVAGCFGIGKGTAVKALRSNCLLSLLGLLDSPIEAVISQATVFMSVCYGNYGYCESMSDTRFQVWATKLGKGTSSKLCCLPPTSEAFAENVKRAHYQSVVWRSLEESNPPDIDPVVYGWKKEERTKSLQPVQLPADIALAPEFILKMIRCGCQSSLPCSTKLCRCKNASMNCTIFCECYQQGCYNEN